MKQALHKLAFIQFSGSSGHTALLLAQKTAKGATVCLSSKKFTVSQF